MQPLHLSASVFTAVPHFLARFATTACVLLAFSGPSHAATYYLDVVNGSDAFAGTSPLAAWKSLAFASIDKFKPGDSILLKRGCRWNEGLRVHSTGTPQHLFYIGPYGSGPAPVINDSTDALRYRGEPSG